jgi:hypothetical protein
VLLAELAAALGGRSFEESGTQAAASYLRTIIGTGPTAGTRRVLGQEALAPYVAGAALALLLVVALPPGLLRRRALATGRRHGKQRRADALLARGEHANGA